jgi:hypothetical protein
MAISIVPYSTTITSQRTSIYTSSSHRQQASIRRKQLLLRLGQYLRRMNGSSRKFTRQSRHYLKRLTDYLTSSLMVEHDLNTTSAICSTERRRPSAAFSDVTEATLNNYYPCTEPHCLVSIDSTQTAIPSIHHLPLSVDLYSEDDSDDSDDDESVAHMHTDIYASRMQHDRDAVSEQSLDEDDDDDDDEEELLPTRHGRRSWSVWFSQHRATITPIQYS